MAIPHVLEPETIWEHYLEKKYRKPRKRPRQLGHGPFRKRRQRGRRVIKP